ncbi:hypothetical protein DL768_007896 [Monosporascus sp. mg162]|nr:hypothetical protein DL768_007896 [Monosporascus sp. mg162]
MEVSQDTLYDYEPLPSTSTVRIVQLYPAASITDPLEFDFAYLDRYAFGAFSSSNNGDGPGFYDAVSYVWGEPAFTHRIFCRRARSYVAITAAVHDMLMRLRKRKRHPDQPPLPLWLDGICLHQANDAEKSVQVPLMGEIYHQARLVRIWLGGSDPDVGKTFRFLRTVALQRVQAQHRRGLADVVRAALRETFGAPVLGSVLKLLHNPWFQRRWVVQEASLCHEAVVHCGESSIAWPWFADGLDALLQVHADLRLDGTALKALRVANAIKRNRGTLLENLWEFHTTVCLDPRDRIFALYGLASDSGSRLAQSRDGSPRAVIDYSRPWMDTYTSVSRYWIQEGRFVEVLRHLSAFGTLWEVDSTRPSWVPNWSTERHRQLDFPGGLRLFDAPEFVRHANWKGLKLRGRQLGEVARLFDRWPAEQSGDLQVVAQYLSTAVFNPRFGPGARDVSTIADILGLFCLALRRSGEARSPYVDLFRPVPRRTDFPTNDELIMMLLTKYVLSPLHGDATAYEQLDDRGVEQVARQFQCVLEAWARKGVSNCEEKDYQIPDQARGDNANENKTMSKRRVSTSEICLKTPFVRARLEPLMKDVGAMMRHGSMFLSSDGVGFVGPANVKVHDRIVRLTALQGNLSVPNPDTSLFDLDALAFVFRPVTVTMADGVLQFVYHFIGCCYGVKAGMVRGKVLTAAEGELSSLLII